MPETAEALSYLGYVIRAYVLAWMVEKLCWLTPDEDWRTNLQLYCLLKAMDKDCAVRNKAHRAYRKSLESGQ